MILYSLTKRLIGVSILLPLLQILPAKGETLWDSFSLNGFENELIKKSSQAKTEGGPYSNNGLLVWRENKQVTAKSIIWKQLSKLSSESIQSKIRGSINKRNGFPYNLKTARALYKSIKPQRKDFILPLRLSPSFPTTNQLPEGDTQLKVFTLSTFSGGAGGGTGNQNYASRFDYGLRNDIQISTFYSSADDPLYKKIKRHSIPSPNYWESYGASVKVNLLNKQSWKIAFEGSLESWKVKNGPPNIFNYKDEMVSNKSLIGSISTPISIELNNNIQLNFTPGISFLPDKQGSGYGNEGKFYGNNIFAGGGISWSPIDNLRLISSAIFPFGPGYNNFDSNLEFSRETIYNLGINWDINPRIGIEGVLTNGFGATPSTGILTIPSDNVIGYYAGIKYTPLALDSPQRYLSRRESSLSMGGLTVNTALVPPSESVQIWGNFDDSGNTFGYLGYSLSNSFQLDALNIGKFNGVPKKEGKKATLVRNYADDEGIKTRVGAKFVLASPLRQAPFWIGARLSAGRGQGLSDGQGYLFSELIATWEATNWLAININPKLAWNAFTIPKGIGVGANIQIAKNLQLIPEFNIVNNNSGDPNNTIALRWLAKDNLHLDLYTSTAAGLQDIGQLLSSDTRRLGARFNISY